MPKLVQAHLEQFERTLRQDDRAPGTIENYLRHVRSFAAWAKGSDITPEMAAAWKKHLQGAGYAPDTINCMLVSLNRFFGCAGWEGCKVRLLRIQRKLFRDNQKELTRAEYARLLAAARAQRRERLALLIEAICATGIRVSEARYLTVEAARAGRAEVSLKGKARVIMIPGSLRKKLLAFAKQKKTTSGTIFRTRNGSPISRKQIWAEMKSLCQKAGVAPTKVFPHNLRHLFARVYYNRHHDVAKLADVLGHSSLETTRIYLISTGWEHQRQLEQLGLVS